MSAKRYLIVNADDFGQSRGINRGVAEAHERGIVTSASLMVRWPAAREAAEYGRSNPTLSLGLHFDICEWSCRDGEWFPLYEVVSAEDASAVAEEFSRQLAAFRRLVGQNPTHLDSHQHVHRSGPAQSVLTDAAREMGVPLRGCGPEIRYDGNFYGQTGKGESYPSAITVEGLIKTLSSLPPGVTELGCHPGFGDGLDSMYLAERAQEVKTLCDPEVRAALLAERIELCSFRDLARIATGEE